MMRYVVPALAVVLLGWWLYQATAVYAERWYDPTEPYSVATVLVQWGIALLGLLAANRWMAARTLAETSPVGREPGA